jgi:hypothetical protein
VFGLVCWWAESANVFLHACEITFCFLASPKRTDKSGKKEPEVELPPEPTGPLPPQPGSEEWEFVDRPIDVVSIP